MRILEVKTTLRTGQGSIEPEGGLLKAHTDKVNKHLKDQNLYYPDSMLLKFKVNINTQYLEDNRGKMYHTFIHVLT